MFMFDTLGDVLGFLLVFSTLFLFPIALGLYAAVKTVERMIRGPATPEDRFYSRRARRRLQARGRLGHAYGDQATEEYVGEFEEDRSHRRAA